MATPENYEALYNRYEDSRLLLKAENYAYWTIPSAFPENYRKIGHSRNEGNVPIQHDYQSMGAVLVNYLAAKLAGILFPVNQSFFKINPTEILKQVITSMNPEGQEFKSKLVTLENKACKQLFVNASYAQLIQALRYLIITGNCLIKRHNSKTIVYSLRNYVTLRDNEGTVLDIVLREARTYNSLPNEIAKLVSTKYHNEHDEVVIYTRIKRDTITKEDRTNVVFTVSQQIDGVSIGEPSVYPEHLCPYIPVIWNHVNGDSYGRGHVEDHAGDFAKLSDLSRALAIYEIDACKVVNVVKPGSTIDLDSMNEAESGEWVQADPQAIGKLESGDYAKIQALTNDCTIVYNRLASAFMYQGNTRDAERVTAEEIRMNAQEAEKALGGVYSQLSLGMHLPLAYLLAQEVDPYFITAVVAREVELEVVTGVNALGRAAEIQQLYLAIQELAAIIPAMQQITPRFNTEKVIDAVLQSHGLVLEDIMLSEEELKAHQEQAQQAMQASDPLASVQATQQVI